MNVNGISPKVKLPALVLLALGIVCLVAGALLKDATLTTVGPSLIAASGLGASLGYSADVGDIAEPGTQERSDDLLPADVVAKLG